MKPRIDLRYGRLCKRVEELILNLASCDEADEDDDADKPEGWERFRDAVLEARSLVELLRLRTEEDE